MGKTHMNRFLKIWAMIFLSGTGVLCFNLGMGFMSGTLIVHGNRSNDEMEREEEEPRLYAMLRQLAPYEKKKNEAKLFIIYIFTRAIRKPIFSIESELMTINGTYVLCRLTIATIAMTDNSQSSSSINGSWNKKDFL